MRERFQFLRRVENYQVELSTIRQNPKERISDYADRVMKILTKLNQSYSLETGQPLPLEVQAMNNRQAIKTFIDGLTHSELRMTLRLRDFDSIAEAIISASEIKTRISNSSISYPAL